MPIFLLHRNVNIVTLYRDDDLAEHCRPGDVVLKQEDEHWIAYDVMQDGRIEAAGFPCESYDKALETAKAAIDSRAHLR
ncbi:hypothetical protein EGT07_02270 [Herbaspirillum sp. HC18]|nr:hypothetical protein EGT07_02270 [Herbaspirillum sp. HC18]